VARRLPEFVYDPKVCRFKTWLLNLTRWRIQDQLRRCKGLARTGRADASLSPQRQTRPDSEIQDETATIERVPDPAVPEFGADWDAAWEKNLLAKALEQVRAQIDERQFQVFDCCVNKGWASADVAQTLGISVARVYLTKHRVAARLKREVQRLEKLAGSPASGVSIASAGNATRGGS
jgi:RNA polymerase sigma-70 factor (ECF subfamily)